MIPAILTALSGLFAAVGKVFEWLYARDLTNAGKVLAQLSALRAQVDAASQAVAARERQRLANIRDGLADNGAGRDGGVSIDPTDPFLRD